MENSENLVDETENTEELTVEEDAQETVENTNEEELQEDKAAEEQRQEKTFTQDEVNEIVSKRLARKEGRIENRIRKEYEEKYGKLERVVTAGLGTDSVEDATDKLAEFYTKKGINIPAQPKYSDKEIELLAKAEADDIISSGYDDVKDEVDRLASIGLDKMTKSDKIIFKKLADERKRLEEQRDLATLGISMEKLNDEEFIAYNKKLNPELSLKERYEMYLASKPKKEIKKMGSMTGGQESKVKTYYSPDEIARLTDEELDNDAIWEAVRKSMTNQA